METKAYYPSICETLLYNRIGDFNWLKRYKGTFKENKLLSDHPLLSLEEKSLRREFESDYTKLFQYRKQADDLILQFMNEILKEGSLEKEFWKTLLHWFNHQTHHRGQISMLLDLVGVDHDYLSLVTRV